MALIFENCAICSICNKGILSSDEHYSFPPFVQNVKDPLFVFNDATFHLKCLKNNELGLQALEFAKEINFLLKPENRKCIITKKNILNSKDYLLFDVLTSKIKEPLYNFNLITLDITNISNWVEREKFINIATAFNAESKWKDLTNFKYLKHLINIVSGKSNL